MRSPSPHLLCTALLFAVGSAHAEEPLQELAGTHLVCVAGPGVAVARAQAARGEAAIEVASVLPNPKFFAQRQGTEVTGRETILGITVPLGLGGRRFLLQDAARARNDSAQAEAHLTLFESAIAFREAYATAALDQARAEVLSEQQLALDQLTSAVEKLARSGEAAGYDLTRQQAQARLHRRQVESAKARAASSLALLSAWTGKAVTLPPVDLANLAGGVAAASAPVDSSGPAHPRIRSLEAEALASSFDSRAARRRWVPDVDVFAGYRTTTVGSVTDQSLSVSLTIPLTFLDHGQGEAAQAEAERALAQANAQTLRQQQQAEVRASAARLAALEAGRAEIDQAAADAVALQDKASRLYAAGEATITELIDTFRTAEELRLSRVEFAQEIAVARLSLMSASGSLFDERLNQECGGTVGAQP